MKILYLCADPGIELMGNGGGSIHIRSLVCALADLGHQVTVVGSTIGSTGGDAREWRAAIQPAPLAGWNRALAQFTLAANRLIGRTGRLHPDVVRLLHNLTFFRVARATAQRVRPDFIYERYSLWGLTGLWLARDRSIPLVLEVNAPLAFEQQRYRGLTFAPLARAIERRAWSQADLLLAVSESLRGFARDAGATDERIRVLPNAVDPLMFHRGAGGESRRAQLNLEGRFVVGFVGTFKPWHGVDVLIAAFEELHRADPSIHLLLIGDGPLRPALEEHVRAAGLSEVVKFAGIVAHRDMPRYLAAMDVAVAPYPALDTFYYSPLKLFEYMAAGCAVIASRVGQVAQIIEDGKTGLLFEPGDSADLIACLRRLRHDETRRRELGRRASVASRAHTWRQNAARVIGWVEPLLAQTYRGTLPA